jgi:hypothetical protein
MWKYSKRKNNNKNNLKADICIGHKNFKAEDTYLKVLISEFEDTKMNLMLSFLKWNINNFMS